MRLNKTVSKPPVSRCMVLWAAATDVGNRSMRAAGRKAWNADDFNAAVAEFDRLDKAEKTQTVAK